MECWRFRLILKETLIKYHKIFLHWEHLLFQKIILTNPLLILFYLYIILNFAQYSVLENSPLISLISLYTGIKNYPSCIKFISDNQLISQTSFYQIKAKPIVRWCRKATDLSCSFWSWSKFIFLLKKIAELPNMTSLKSQSCSSAF